MIADREDVVQSALNIQKWCSIHSDYPVCDCPFFTKDKDIKCFISLMLPKTWNLEEKLRTRGIEHDK